MSQYYAPVCASVAEWAQRHSSSTNFKRSNFGGIQSLQFPPFLPLQSMHVLFNIRPIQHSLVVRDASATHRHCLWTLHPHRQPSARTISLLITQI